MQTPVSPDSEHDYYVLCFPLLFCDQGSLSLKMASSRAIMQQDLRGWKQRRTVIASILLLLEPLLGISKEESKLGSSSKLEEKLPTTS